MNEMGNNKQYKIDFDGPYMMSIDGQLVGSNSTFEVYNPASGAVIVQAPAGSKDQMEEAIASAKKAQPAWAALSHAERSSYVSAYADALDANIEDIITLLTTEQGKPRHSMAKTEVEAAIFWVREVATVDHELVVEQHAAVVGEGGRPSPIHLRVVQR